MEPLDLARPVTLAELRRHKRVFLKMATQNVGARLSDRQSARRMFVNFLREHLD
jgi:protein KTI12